MSGMWQVLRGEDHSYARRVKIDMLYIKRRGTLLDLGIILRTALLTMRGRGSG